LESSDAARLSAASALDDNVYVCAAEGVNILILQRRNAITGAALRPMPI